MNDKVGWMLFILCVIYFIILGGAIFNNTAEMLSSCDYVNMEYYRLGDADTCVDAEGNTFFVKIECEGDFFYSDCKARKLNIK